MNSDERAAITSPFAGMRTSEILRTYGQILTILRERGITRTEDSPVGGYAEYLARRAFGLTLETNSKAGYDGKDESGARYQMKARRITRWNASRQLSAIRGLADGQPDPFDSLLGILFHEDMSVMRAALVPVSVVRSQSRFQAHVNGSRFHLRDAVWSVPGVLDVTEDVTRVALEEGWASTVTSAIRRPAAAASGPSPLLGQAASRPLLGDVDQLDEFRHRAPLAEIDPRATWPRGLRSPSSTEVARGVVIAYATANFAVYRSVVERLAPGERFRMETRLGTFEISRAEFDASFASIAATASYATGSPSMPGRCYYVQSVPPAGASAYLVGRISRPCG